MDPAEKVHRSTAPARSIDRSNFTQPGAPNVSHASGSFELGALSLERATWCRHKEDEAAWRGVHPKWIFLIGGTYRFFNLLANKDSLLHSGKTLLKILKLLLTN